MSLAEYERADSSPRVRGKPSSGGWCPGAWRLIPARAGKTLWASPWPHDTQAHPRACGENGRGDEGGGGGEGSSPRVRGKRFGLGLGRALQRLIPARAGKTPSRRRAAPSTAGSSPRVRGKPASTRGRRRAPGLIPARAGKTWTRPPFPGAGGAHPRACGENAECSARALTGYGSSPRVRGKLRWRFLLVGFPGLIPARAGKTRTTGNALGRRTAHPRACGENVTPRVRRTSRRGSSPRVRGKREVRVRAPPIRRLIPARAGKTGASEPSPSRPSAHPRACGENPEPGRASPHALGSSPRVRGKPNARSNSARLMGLIPARAGKTSAR